MIKSLGIVRILLVTSVISFSLVACIPRPTVVFTDQKSDNPEKYIPCDVPSQKDAKTRSQSLDIAINVDGSSSMFGYVNQANSRYIQTLDILDRIFSNQGNVEYYRIGTKPQGDQKGIQKLGNRQQFRKAQFPEFYTGLNPSFPAVTSSLDKGITAPQKNNKLLVLVTDLEQNEGDVTNLKNQIEKFYFQDKNKNYAIGVLGIQSEFSGKVTPVARGYKTFNHDGKRPFYVIFVAPYSDILYYYNQIKKSSIGEHEFSIFYPSAIPEEASHLDGKGSIPKGLSNQPSLTGNGIAVEVASPPYNLIELDKRKTEEFKQSPTVLPFSLLEHTLTPATDTLELRYSIKAYDPVQKKFVERPDLANLKQGIEFNNWQLKDNPNQLQFDTTIRPQAFSQPGIYLISTDVVATELQDAAWWSQWDWGSRKNNTDGGKTYGLVNFMDNLKRTTMNLMNNEPAGNVIGRFCYGVQKD